LHGREPVSGCPLSPPAPPQQIRPWARDRRALAPLLTLGPPHLPGSRGCGRPSGMEGPAASLHDREGGRGTCWRVGTKSGQAAWAVTRRGTFGGRSRNTHHPLLGTAAQALKGAHWAHPCCNRVRPVGQAPSLLADWAARLYSIHPGALDDSRAIHCDEFSLRRSVHMSTSAAGGGPGPGPAGTFKSTQIPVKQPTVALAVLASGASSARQQQQRGAAMRRQLPLKSWRPVALHSARSFRPMCLMLQQRQCMCCGTFASRQARSWATRRKRLIG
jgi:hypothetical protein